MKQFFTSADGLKLAFRVEGTGDAVPLLCLSGLTRNMADFDHFVEAIGPSLEGRQIICMDARGRGASDHDPNFANYNIMVEAADAVALLDHLGVEKCIVIGSSRGGYQAMVMAATAPQRLTGVVLNDVGPVLAPEGLGKIMTYLGMPPKAKTLNELAGALRHMNSDAFQNVGDDFWADWAARTVVVTDDGLELNYDAKLRDAIIEQAAALDPDGPRLWPLFDALLPIPTILLRAENSDLLTAEAAADMVARKSDLVAYAVPDRGHIPRLDEEDSLSAIRAFINQL
ncbi:MAG: alpha/beta fold hydrolase [Pikeienuella sp.]